MVGDFLRRQLGYEGVVFTDDLCMGAITETCAVPEAAALAIQAGCDAPLVCHGVLDLLGEVAESLSALPEDALRAAQERLERFRMLIPAPQPPMRFIEWREYAEDVRIFCSRVAEHAGEEEPPASPVQDY